MLRIARYISCWVLYLLAEAAYQFRLKTGIYNPVYGPLFCKSFDLAEAGWRGPWQLMNQVPPQEPVQPRS